MEQSGFCRNLCIAPGDELTHNARGLTPDGASGGAPALLLQDRSVGGYEVSQYSFALEDIPVDFFADPDGVWDIESIAEAAGFGSADDVAVGALTRSFRGHEEGCAVVTLNSKDRPYVAIVRCPEPQQLFAKNSAA